MALPPVLSGNVQQDIQNGSPTAGERSFNEEKCFSANSSFGNSPLLDKERILRYSAKSRDEFWDALSSNYDYLMDDGLIASCREASSDLSLDDENEIPEACCWSFTQFIEQFKWLHDLLHNLQVAKEEDDKETSSKILEEQQKIAYLCKLFNEQAQKLSKRYPDMRDEVHRHLNLLNNKWKAVGQSINPNKVKSPSKDCVFSEITNRMRNLRRWLRELENRLCPVNLASNWTLEYIEEKYREQQALQIEIEAKGKYVSSLLKLCEQLKGNVPFGQNPLMIWDSERVRKVANNLENRWHSIWLRNLECHCILEELMLNSETGCEKLEKSFSEEPLKKYPRLSGNFEDIVVLENELTSKMSYKVDDVFVDEYDVETSNRELKNIASQKADFSFKNDKAVMVGDTGIAELKAECGGSGKFEIVQDIGYSSETSAHLSNDEKVDSTDIQVNGIDVGVGACKFSCNNILMKANLNSNKMYLAPDKYPSVSLKTLHILYDDKTLYKSKFSDCKGVPDTFYQVTSVDNDILEPSEASIVSSDVCSNFSKVTKALTSSNAKNEQNSLVCSNKTAEYQMSFKSHKTKDQEGTVNSHKDAQKDGILNKQSSAQSDNHISSNFLLPRKVKRNPKASMNCSKTLQPNELWKKSARVREWLNTCKSVDDCTSDDNLDTHEKMCKSDCPHKTVDSSCDASGECTTTESDSEKSNASDVNNSVSFSQSFTGSIETVIPAVPEESCVVQSDRAGSAEPSPCIRMRKKKRTTRDRPWSVIEVHQSAFAPSVPHSTSESALDLLYSSQENGKSGFKRNSSEKKRLSLTDVSALSCPSIKSHRLSLNSKGSTRQSSSGSDKQRSRKKKSSTTDSSDNCDTMPCSIPEVNSSSRKSSFELRLDPLLKCPENIGNVQDELSEKMCSLQTTSSLETDKDGSAVITEDQASISDQAWDEYQDPPYLSEPYSEQTADEDEVRKLINFGDDYRAILGSYSDGSSISVRVPPSKSHKTKTKAYLQKISGEKNRAPFVSDSNSDSEDFYNILKTSRRALQFVSNSIKENTTKMSSLSSEFAELVATCQTNLCHLNAIRNEIDAAGCELESFSKEDMLELQGLIKEWEDLQVKLMIRSRSDNDQKPSDVDLEAAVIDVHCSLASLKEKLGTMAVNATDAVGTAHSLQQLTANIQNLQAALSNLQELKESVLSVSARILRLIAEGGGHAITPLRDNAAKLYQQWEDVYELNCSQLTKLQMLQSHWHQSAEEEMDQDLETTVQWQPVQVGDNLPTPEVKTEDLYQNTAAEVQVADKHDILLEMESELSKTTIQCNIFESEKEELKDPVINLNPPPVKNWSKNNLGKDDHQVLPRRDRSCFWRTLRATVPIQFALVILYCMSCLMQPQCCENMNNLEFSLFPRLRYFEGPPPV